METGSDGPGPPSDRAKDDRRLRGTDVYRRSDDARF